MNGQGGVVRLESVSDEVLDALVDVHVGLSPENLSADGELPRRLVLKRRDALLAKFRRVVTSAGLTEENAGEVEVLMEWEKRRKLRSREVNDGSASGAHA